MALRTSAQTLLSRARTLGPAAATSTFITNPSSPPFLSPILTKNYHATSRLAAYKDDQDRESVKPRRAEGTVSGNDGEVAEKADAAFNPNITKPEDAKAAAARESNGNPLDGSGASQGFSKPQKREEVEDKTDKKTRSKGSGGQKHGKVGPM
ncbi:hypothetical protein C8A00DRAFT_14496 [Chaetomidium leptoderma]|uniref:Uncharacterized protein n=1 Tax=Chaetomidium leptoderma TaxID=669021 RepID=A0AAN6VN20_9PEZI|nr:hypothetical protein C8A00DRAFT_14496 [Chaetomidium leptoderma]